jgi:hypothetical protein
MLGQGRGKKGWACVADKVDSSSSMQFLRFADARRGYAHVQAQKEKHKVVDGWERKQLQRCGETIELIIVPVLLVQCSIAELSMRIFRRALWRWFP